MFVACGEALWDLFAVDGDPLSFQARPGGSPLNVAVALARLGHAASLFAGMSTDGLGERLVAMLRAEGVETMHLVRSQRPTTISLINVGERGAPRYAIYGEAAADRMVTADDLPRLGPEVWGVHAGSFAMVAEPVGAALLALFTREARRRLLSIDPNVRLVVQPDRSLWAERVSAFCRLADIVKASDEDLGLLYPGADAATVADGWLAAGVGLIVVTRGADGAEAFCRAGRIAVGGCRVPVVDTVGAGDTFQAALISGLAERGVRNRPALDGLDRDTVAALLDGANAAAALACSRRGADPPRRSELPPPLMEVS